MAVSLSEFEDFICHEANFSQCPNYYHLRIVIDVANGHMEKIFKLSRIAKIIHGNRLEIMSGNIANPKTYDNYCEACIDYVRVGIGGGAGCITSSNTGIHDGIASLLNDIDNIKVDRRLHGKFCTKVIADGGIRGYADVIKALALGADYVMIGSLLVQTVESAAPIYKKNMIGAPANGSFSEVTTKDIRPLNDDKCFGKWIDKDGKVYHYLYKEFYGMASKYGQISINGEKTKTSEGIKKEIEVTTNLDTWVENMTAYLRSAMSYCNITDVKRFTPSRVTVQVISNNTLNSINK